MLKTMLRYEDGKYEDILVGKYPFSMTISFLIVFEPRREQ